MPKQATLADIAKKSKVSVSTVSLVLRDRPGIPDETRQRVIDAANELGYAAKQRAVWSRMPQPASKLSKLGLVVKAERDQPPQADPFYSYVVGGIEEVCRRDHINLLYATIPVDSNNVPVEIPHLIQQDELDGLLLVGAFVGAELHEELRAKQVPVVLVDAYATPHRYDAVLSDNARGAHQAVTYLIENGHKHIGLVGTLPHAYPSILQRRTAYERALMEHGIKKRYFADSSSDAAQVARVTKTLLEKNPQITALFGASDTVAITALNTATAMGRRVPQDLSIIGFDDIELAQNVTPPLTTMHVDKINMGRLAVQLLSDRVQFPESEKIITLLQPRLVERQSVLALLAQ
jgi:LacI family transcriptional regulator